MSTALKSDSEHDRDIQKYRLWLAKAMNIAVETIIVEDLYVDSDEIHHYKITIIKQNT